MQPLTYRTVDNTRWGGGNGSDLSASQVDMNFWTIAQAIQAIQDNPNNYAGIDYVSQVGNLLYIHLTDHRVLGPFTLPTAEWNPRGEWLPDTPYAPFDTVSFDGSLYLITIAHTSGTTFSPFSTDGNGHYLYNLILSTPQNVLPLNGNQGQRLVRQNGSPLSTSWEYDSIRLFAFIEGQPNPGETILQYPVVDHMVFPAGLAGSVVYQAIPNTTLVVYEINLNGAAIGSINFEISPQEITVTMPTAIACVPGDVLTLVAPATPDPVQSAISFTLVAQLTD